MSFISRETDGNKRKKKKSHTAKGNIYKFKPWGQKRKRKEKKRTGLFTRITTYKGRLIFRGIRRMTARGRLGRNLIGSIGVPATHGACSCSDPIREPKKASKCRIATPIRECVHTASLVFLIFFWGHLSISKKKKGRGGVAQIERRLWLLAEYFGARMRTS